MRKALRLARKGWGLTSPNPAVGAVIVDDGAVVGEGWTQPRGQDHAEVMAIRQAGPMAEGAILYTTLEPCCHYGRTPPCTDAIIAAGISEVHSAVVDPNPLVSGKGHSALRDAGIRTVTGEGEAAARKVMEAYFKFITTGLPFVTAKFAMSLDGKIATRTGDSKWVTGPEARQYVQRMRRQSDAVLAGINTILADDPMLTVRDESGQSLPHQPLRVITDSRCRTPANAQVLKQPGLTLIATTADAPPGNVAQLEEAGAEVLFMPAGTDGRVEMSSLLVELGHRGIVNLMAEGGGIVLGSLFDAGLVDKVYAFIAPVIIGGQDAASPVEGQGIELMTKAWVIDRSSLQAIGPDWLIVGYPAPQS